MLLVQFLGCFSGRMWRPRTRIIGGLLEPLAFRFAHFHAWVFFGRLQGTVPRRDNLCRARIKQAGDKRGIEHAHQSKRVYACMSLSKRGHFPLERIDTSSLSAKRHRNRLPAEGTRQRCKLLEAGNTDCLRSCISQSRLMTKLDIGFILTVEQPNR